MSELSFNLGPPDPLSDLAQAIFTLAYVMKVQALAADLPGAVRNTSQEILYSAVKLVEHKANAKPEIIRHLLEYLASPDDSGGQPKPPAHLQIVK